MRDIDVRRAVLGSLKIAHAGDRRTRIVEEMNVWSGSVRIDVAVINGALCGWEIKSDKDDLSRLPLQSEIYSRVFDKVTLVTGQRHLSKAIPIVPKWWTIISASMSGGSANLEIEREGSENPDQDPLLIAALLWKDEAIEILDAQYSARGWRGKRIKEIHQHLAALLPLDVLKREVRTTLKARQNWLRQD